MLEDEKLTCYGGVVDGIGWGERLDVNEFDTRREFGTKETRTRE